MDDIGPGEKDLRVLVETLSTKYEPGVCPGGQESLEHPGLYENECGLEEHGSDCSPVLITVEATL